MGKGGEEPPSREFFKLRAFCPWNLTFCQGLALGLALFLAWIDSSGSLRKPAQMAGVQGLHLRHPLTVLCLPVCFLYTLTLSKLI